MTYAKTPGARLRVLTVGVLAFSFWGAPPVATAATSVPVTIAAAVAAKEVKRATANLNLRLRAGTNTKVLLVIPRDTQLAISATSGGWSKTTYRSKTGWVSTAYLKPAEAKKPGLGKSTATLNLRKQATTSSKVLGSIPKGAILELKATQGKWKRVTHRGKTGWVNSGYLKGVANKPGREIYIEGAYTSNRAGLTDRYYTKTAGSGLRSSVNGPMKIGDIPRYSVAYRDLAQERKAGGVAGWYFVRTQGTYGWMKTSALQRNSTAPTVNSKEISRATVHRQVNGKVPASMLVAIPWDREKTLIAAPALADLTHLNASFKKKFGTSLTIDLAYRTRETQDYYWTDLGPLVAARPGTSNHGWGTAIDLPETYDYSFRGKYFKWLKVNSKKYNWVHRSYLEEGSKYAEAWHFEYVGR
ncbi:SH3 domain-containing protein [Paeniglutamicibacter cryotolerans]|uniref:SH3-like domain-containing protein n=1 Tax=Paeniglutamicibacter cryotolerans TaxID=670079 RepID=A0A839QQT0_9MICC|nr:SH3 domain-containing protein [Paeniglutamicibacter cryotolerans]MBB2994431.1 SH3-like domain-containing protein [Paeniglutamicibacter cryotolerans]